MNVIAVDVGTTSVRLAIISFTGPQLNEVEVIKSHKKDIHYSQEGLKFEQNSSEIWDSICECSKKCFNNSNIRTDSIKGIAFSATCSLVITEQGTSRKNDVIMWMDHRAINQAHDITSSRSKVLKQFGGTCSPEFTLSKLQWLKDKDPQRFESATGFFELPDWLVYKCLSSPSLLNQATCARSLCCVTCKWGYDVENDSHCDVINSLDPNIRSRIGNRILSPGSLVGYLNRSAAVEMGLLPKIQESYTQDKENLVPATPDDNISLNIAVGCSLIDAHSGMLAMLSVPLDDQVIRDKRAEIETCFCSLAGTSSCHMLLSQEATFVPGIWGPYKDVILKDYYLLEAGQSLTGKLIEICIESHEEGKSRIESGESIHGIIESLNKQIEASNVRTSSLHILPSFHGNRSPLANPRLKGGIYGLSSEGVKGLLEHYVATVESLAYEMKLIVETLGTKLDDLRVSGGLMKNGFYMQTLADVLCCRVVAMSLNSIDFMVMGSGLVARHAALISCSNQQSQSLAGTLDIIPLINNKPLDHNSIQDLRYKQLHLKSYYADYKQTVYHEKKYLCYKEFVQLSLRFDKILK